MKQILRLRRLFYHFDEFRWIYSVYIVGELLPSQTIDRDDKLGIQMSMFALHFYFS